MFPILFETDSFIIYSYGFFSTLAVLVSFLIYQYLLRKSNLDFLKYYFLFFGLVFFGLIGSKIAYLVEHKMWEIEKWYRLFYFWESGLSSLGGVLLSLIFLFVFINLYSMPLWKTLDIVSISFIFGLSVGKLGCLSRGCCYGKPTSSFIGIIFPPKAYGAAPVGIPLWPTQLIEFIGYLIIGLFSCHLWKKKVKNGVVFNIIIILYPSFRFFVEFFRGSTSTLPGIGLTWNQIVCFLLLITGLLLLRFGKNSSADHPHSGEYKIKSQPRRI